MLKLVVYLFFPVLIFGISYDYAQQALDPIFPLNQLQWEDDFTPLNAHAEGISNILYLKPLFKIPPNHLIPLFQGMRFEFQWVTTPHSVTTKPVTTLGDTQFFDLFLWRGDEWEIGLGPMAIFPTALKPSTGQGKWQLGPALGFLCKHSEVQFGFLAQNPISFAGKADRADQNYLLLQPFFIQHLTPSWYVKVNPQWTLDWIHQDTKIPLNLGLGKIFKLGHQPISMELAAEVMLYDNSKGFIPQFTLQFFFNLLFENEHD